MSLAAIVIDIKTANTSPASSPTLVRSEENRTAASAFSPVSHSNHPWGCHWSILGICSDNRAPPVRILSNVLTSVSRATSDPPNSHHRRDTHVYLYH